MRLILVDRQKELCEVLRWRFRSNAEVEVVCGRFEELPAFDCIVTAGNSFGLMDGGVDLAVARFYGRSLMDLIQRRILDEFMGEQPVGTCIIAPTGHPVNPFMAHAPTMRIPMNIQGTDNVYLAMWAVLTAIHRHNRVELRKIDTLACPGLGTGTGGMDPVEASLQMHIAYEHFCHPPTVINPSLAQERHEKIYYGGRWGFEHPR